MPVVYDSSRSPIPHDELSKECRAGYLADVKKVLTHYRLFNEKSEAKNYYDLCGGKKYFGMEYKYLVHQSEFNVIMDNGKSILIDRSNRKPWIMDANDLLSCIGETLSSLKGSSENQSEFQISEVKAEMRRNWRFYSNSVDRAFFALNVPKVLPDTDVGVDPKISRTFECVDLTSNEERHDASSSVASKEKKRSAKELDEHSIGSFGYSRDTVDHGDSSFASNDVSSHSNYYYMREEFRSCLLKGADPKALLAKYDVDHTVAEFFLEELIEERANEISLKKTTQSRTTADHAAMKGHFDDYKDERNQNRAVLLNRHDLASKQHENIGKVVDALKEQRRDANDHRKFLDEEMKERRMRLDEEVNERRKLLNEESNERRKRIDKEAECADDNFSVFNARFEASMNDMAALDKEMKASYQQNGEERRDLTRTLKASLEANTAVKVAEEEMKMLERMRGCIGKGSSKVAAHEPDAAIAEQKKPASTSSWFDRVRGLTGWDKTCTEPVVQNITEPDAAAEFGVEESELVLTELDTAAEFGGDESVLTEPDAAAEFGGEESIPIPTTPVRPPAEKERKKSVRRSQRTPAPIDRFGTY